MGERTGISWCDHTLNFWEGCTKVSPGCDNCYAAARNHRFSAGANWGPGAPRRERLLRACEEARKLNRKAKDAGERRRVFVNSLSDFFDNEVPDDWRAYALGVMRACDWLDFQVLTKRIGNVRDMIAPWNFWPLPNVWLGITVVNQEEADRDIPKLLEVPAAVRWLSCEPLLEAINLSTVARARLNTPLHALSLQTMGALYPAVLPSPWIDWVIVGGESGTKARTFHLDWARSLLDQCKTAGIPFFMKQVGPLPTVDAEHVLRPRNRAGADPAEWPEDLQVREFPA